MPILVYLDLLNEDCLINETAKPFVKSNCSVLSSLFSVVLVGRCRSDERLY